MLLQTNSYIVPRDKRVEHARLLRRFRQTLLRLGLDHFEVYEQVGANWATGDTGRFVQIMRFRDRKHQVAVQMAERADATAQTLLREFCELINLPYQQQQGLFAVGYYTGFLRMPMSAQESAAPVAPADNGQTDAAEVPSESAEQAAPEGAAENAGEPEANSPVNATAEGNGKHVEVAEAGNESEPAVLAEVAPAGESEPVPWEPDENPAGTETSETSVNQQATDAEQIAESAQPEHSDAELGIHEASGGNSEGEKSVPEFELGSERLADDALPDASVADETAGPMGLISMDENEDTMNAEAAGEIPLDLDGIDADSLFLATAEEETTDEPGRVRPLHPGEDAHTGKPGFPSNS